MVELHDAPQTLAGCSGAVWQFTLPMPFALGSR